MDSRLVAVARNSEVFAANSCAFRARLQAAGLRPKDLLSVDALSRLAVLKKDQLLALQAENPPFAGFLGCEAGQVVHYFVSPGPIYEPLIESDTSGHGMQKMFEAAGVSSNDVALNTWSYHLVPAGLLMDRALRSCGAAVIPAGPGNTDLQLQIIRSLRPTLFLGSTAYFRTIVERLEAEGSRLPQDWSIRHAFLGGEIGDWQKTRRDLEQRLGVQTWSCYGTADVGLVGYEVRGESGYRIYEQRIVQVCDPASGTPLPCGQSGEIVVTTLSPGWPMIRFGTGDLSHAIETDEYGFVARLAFIEGRVGSGVKVREIFIYPRHAELLAKQVAGLEEVRIGVTRSEGRDEVELEVRVGSPGASDLEIENAFRSLTRLKADRLTRVQTFTIGNAIVDRR